MAPRRHRGPPGDQSRHRAPWHEARGALPRPGTPRVLRRDLGEVAHERGSPNPRAGVGAQPGRGAGAIERQPARRREERPHSAGSVSSPQLASCRFAISYAAPAPKAATPRHSADPPHRRRVSRPSSGSSTQAVPRGKAPITASGVLRPVCSVRPHRSRLPVRSAKGWRRSGAARTAPQRADCERSSTSVNTMWQTLTRNIVPQTLLPARRPSGRSRGRTVSRLPEAAQKGPGRMGGRQRHCRPGP